MTTNAAVRPVMIMICWTVVSRPRMFGGRDFGDVGGREDARRADRHAAADSRNHEDDVRWATPCTSAPTRNSTAASIIVLRRPMRSARRPAKNAPMKQPISSDATVKPRPFLGEKLPATRLNAGSQAVLGAVHGAAVIAEQEPADRRHSDDRADKSHVRALRTCYPWCTLSLMRNTTRPMLPLRC